MVGLARSSVYFHLVSGSIMPDLASVMNLDAMLRLDKGWQELCYEAIQD